MASCYSQHVVSCSSSVSHCKRSCCRCFNRPGTQGSVIPAFNPLAADRCDTQKKVLFCLLSGCGGDDSIIYSKSLPAVLERMGRLMCSKRLPNNAISSPKLADCLVHLFRVGLACHTIGINYTVISDFFGKSLSS